jgi:sortase A
MTSCNPRFGAEERIIAYALLDSWRPAAAGPPAEIAAQVAAATGRN